METTDAIRNRRTIRFFCQKPVDDSILCAMVQAAALAPSAANLQVLRYRIVRTPELREAILAETGWAGYVRPERTPVAGKTGPAAFIAAAAPPEAEKNPHTYADAGASIEAMLLQGMDSGVGGCWIGSFDRKKVDSLLGLTDLTTLYLVAVGFPAEQPVREILRPGDSVRYYLDGDNVLHVPKYEGSSISVFL